MRAKHTKFHPKYSSAMYRGERPIAVEPETQKSSAAQTSDPERRETSCDATAGSRTRAVSYDPRDPNELLSRTIRSMFSKFLNYDSLLGERESTLPTTRFETP